MLKCCGCQTNFILPLGGSFLFSKNFLPTPSLTGGLVMPIRRTNKKDLTSDDVRSQHGGGLGIRTLATVTRPNDLANRPLQPLE